MDVIHCNFRDYNSHPVDYGNTQQETLEISKIAYKVVIYTAFQRII